MKANFTPVEFEATKVENVPETAKNQSKRSKYQGYIDAALDGEKIKIIPKDATKINSIRQSIKNRIKKNDLKDKVCVAVSDGAVYVFPYEPVV